MDVVVSRKGAKMKLDVMRTTKKGNERERSL